MRRKMFRRVYLYGVLLLVVAVAAAIAVHKIVGGTPHWRGTARRYAQRLGKELGARPTDLKKLASKLEAFRHITAMDVAVYAVDGTRLGAAGSNPPKPLSASKARSLKAQKLFHRGASFYVAIPLDPKVKDSAYLAFQGHAGRGLIKFAVTLLVILLAVGLVSIPLARSIARPLERLTGTARQLADGDLSARSGLDRKDEVGVLARTIDEMAGQLEHRIHTEKELLANVSHEIRTPLARIRVALELCSDDRSDLEKIRAHLSSIEEDISELDRLVDDVLVASRLDLAVGSGEGKGFTPRKTPMSVREAADQAARRFAVTHPEHTLEVQVSADLPQVQAEAALIRRVLGNLLDNAAKYSEKNQAVTLSASADAENVTVEIIDRGIGVGEEDLEHLFEPFFRTDRSRSRGTGGTGLGLTLCKRIVEAHEGAISALQNPEGGTTVRFSLPLSGTGSKTDGSA